MEFISDAWYPVLDAASLPRASKLLRLKRFATDMVLWKSEAGYTLQDDRCPHKGAPLSLGKVVQGRVRCPYHGMEFDGSGTCRFIPQLADQSNIPKAFRTKPYTTRLEHGMLWMWWGDREPTSELPYFPEIAGETKLSSALCVEYPASFVRTMEGFFDQYHVPHLHGWPLSMGTVIQESELEIEGPYIRCNNVFVDSKSGESSPGKSTVLFPCLSLLEWDQRGAPVKLLATATPIDERSTWVLMRHYVRAFRVPVIGPMLCALHNLLSRLFVVPVDARLQSLQTPQSSGIGRDQLILPADRGIIEYWRMLRQARGAAPSKIESERVSVANAERIEQA